MTAVSPWWFSLVSSCEKKRRRGDGRRRRSLEGLGGHRWVGEEVFRAEEDSRGLTDISADGGRGGDRLKYFI